MFGRDCICGHMWACHGWRWHGQSACAACNCYTYHPRKRVPFGFRWLARRLRDALDE